MNVERRKLVQQQAGVQARTNHLRKFLQLQQLCRPNERSQAREMANIAASKLQRSPLPHDANAVAAWIPPDRSKAQVETPAQIHERLNSTLLQAAADAEWAASAAAHEQDGHVLVLVDPVTDADVALPCGPQYVCEVC